MTPVSAAQPPSGKPERPDGAAPILCVGAAHWDWIARAATQPSPGSDLPGRVVRRPGGVAFNIALALAEQGLRVALRARIGRDADGAALVEAAAAAGIATDLVLRHPGPSNRYLAIEGPDGALFGAVADCRGVDASGAALASDLGGGWRCLVIDGNLPDAALAVLPAADLVLAAASPAKAARLRPLAQAGARLYLNRAEAEALCGARFTTAREAALAVRRLGATEAVVTDGAAPAAASGPDGLAVRAPAPAATRSLTGAGDRFLATHLAVRLAGAAPEAALAAALAAATRHITREAP